MNDLFIYSVIDLFIYLFVLQNSNDINSLRSLSAESVVMVTGKVQLRPDGLANKVCLSVPDVYRIF